MSDLNLGLQSFKAVLWNVVGKLLGQVVGFAIGIVLARIIAPDDYGLIAMSFVVINVVGVFIDSGFSISLIRKKEVTDNDYHTAFWFNLLASIFVFLLIYLTAPLIQSFFNAQGLTPVVRWLSFGLIISSFGFVQNIELNRQLNFKALNIINLGSAVVSGTLGIAAAYLNYGVWALVVQQLSSRAVTSIGLIFYRRRKVRWIFSVRSFREIWQFGSKMLASSVINVVFENLYAVIIGRWFSAATLAFYNRAESYQQLLSRNITGMVQSVTTPVLAKIQDDDERLKQGYSRLIQMVMLFTAPAMLGFLVLAPELIRWLLTEKWMPTVPYLQWLCIEGLLYPLHAININILIAKGKGGTFLKLEIIKKILLVAFILAGLPWGVMGLVVGRVLFSITAYFLNSHYSLGLIHYGFREQFADLWLIFLFAGTMACMVWTIGWLLPLKGGALVAMQFTAGFLVYFLLCRIFNLSALSEFIDLMRRILKSPKE